MKRNALTLLAIIAAFLLGLAVATARQPELGHCDTDTDCQRMYGGNGDPE